MSGDDDIYNTDRVKPFKFDNFTESSKHKPISVSRPDFSVQYALFFFSIHMQKLFLRRESENKGCSRL